LVRVAAPVPLGAGGTDPLLVERGRGDHALALHRFDSSVADQPVGRSAGGGGAGFGPRRLVEKCLPPPRWNRHSRSPNDIGNPALGGPVPGLYLCHPSNITGSVSSWWRLHPRLERENRKLGYPHPGAPAV